MKISVNPPRTNSLKHSRSEYKEYCLNRIDNIFSFCKLAYITQVPSPEIEFFIKFRNSSVTEGFESLPKELNQIIFNFLKDLKLNDINKIECTDKTLTIKEWVVKETAFKKAAALAAKAAKEASEKEQELNNLADEFIEIVSTDDPLPPPSYFSQIIKSLTFR